MSPPSLLSHDEVNARLTRHTQWLSSGGREGGCATFSNCQIDGFNFKEQQLRGFSTTEIVALWAAPQTDSFPNPRIDGANFSGAWLNNCNFEAANCTRCNFFHVKATHCNFKNTILVAANLDGSIFIDCESDDERICQISGEKETESDEKINTINGLHSEISRLKQELGTSKNDSEDAQAVIDKLNKELETSQQEGAETNKQLQGMVEAQGKGQTYYGSAFASLRAAKTEANRQLETLTDRRDWLNKQAMGMVNLVKQFAWSFIFGLSVLAICTLLINIDQNKLTFLNSLIRYMAGATIFAFTCTLALFALVGRTQRQMLTFSRVIMAYETYESMLNFSMAMEPIRDKKTKDPINLEFGRAVNSFMAQTFREVRKNSFAYFNRKDQESAEPDVFSGLHELSRIFGANGGRKNTKQP